MQPPIMETITPAKAERYLNRNTGNRKLRPGVAEKYAHDMRNGKWTDCIVPIAFYENGDVADGQHRLWAVVDSQTTQKFLVVRNLTREVGLNIDTGLTRSLVDNARISGLNSELTNEMVSYARALQTGTRTHTAMSNAERLEIVEKHLEVLKWVCSNGPTGRGLRNQCVMAAIARAWYYEADKERLARFCKVLSTGYADGEHESAAVAIRNYLMTKRDAHLTQLFNDTFCKLQNAISHFMQGKKLMVIKPVREEQYPLPKPHRQKKTA